MRRSHHQEVSHAGDDAINIQYAILDGLVDSWARWKKERNLSKEGGIIQNFERSTKEATN